MRLRLGVFSTCVILGALALPGCKDPAQEISSAGYLLGRLHKLWDRTAQSLRSEKPNLNLLRSLDMLLDDTAARMEKESEHDRPDKDEVLTRLKAIRSAYKAEVASKLDLTRQEVALKPGVTTAELRSAFEKIDADYQGFVAIAPAE